MTPFKVRCINNHMAARYLTLDKIYTVKRVEIYDGPGESGLEVYFIEDDQSPSGQPFDWESDRFERVD